MSSFRFISTQLFLLAFAAQAGGGPWLHLHSHATCEHAGSQEGDCPSSSTPCRAACGHSHSHAHHEHPAADKSHPAERPIGQSTAFAAENGESRATLLHRAAPSHPHDCAICAHFSQVVVAATTAAKSSQGQAIPRICELNCEQAGYLFPAPICARGPPSA